MAIDKKQSLNILKQRKISRIGDLISSFSCDLNILRIRRQHGPKTKARDILSKVKGYMNVQIMAFINSTNSLMYYLNTPFLCKLMT